MYSALDRSIFDPFGDMESLEMSHVASGEEFTDFDNITDFSPKTPAKAFDDDSVELEEAIKDVTSDEEAINLLTTVLGYDGSELADGSFKTEEFVKELKAIVNGKTADDEPVERHFLTGNLAGLMLQIAGRSKSKRSIPVEKQRQYVAAIVPILKRNCKDLIVAYKETSAKETSSSSSYGTLFYHKKIGTFNFKEMVENQDLVLDVGITDIKPLQGQTAEAWIFYSQKDYNAALQTFINNFKEAKEAFGIEKAKAGDIRKKLNSFKYFSLDKKDVDKVFVPYTDYEKEAARKVANYITDTPSNELKKTGKDKFVRDVEENIIEVVNSGNVTEKSIINAMDKAEKGKTGVEGFKFDKKFIDKLRKSILNKTTLEGEDTDEVMKTIKRVLAKHHYLEDDFVSLAHPARANRPASRTQPNQSQGQQQAQQQKDAQDGPKKIPAGALQQAAKDYVNSKAGKKARSASKELLSAYADYKQQKNKKTLAQGDFEEFLKTDQGKKVLSSKRALLSLASEIKNKQEMVNMRTAIKKAKGVKKNEPVQIGNGKTGVLLERVNKIKKLKESEANDMVDLMRFDMLEDTIYLESADDCVNSGLGMSDLLDLLSDVFPTWAGIDSVEKAKRVLQDSTKPEAEEYLSMLNTAIANAKEADKLLNSYAEAGISPDDLLF